MDHVTRATPLSGMIGRSRANTSCKHTKFDDATFSRSTDISGGVKF